MNPQFRDAFLQGFSSTFRQWTALELAVHNEWGGPQSADKANELMNQVLALFDDPKTMYKDVSIL
jgi:pre-rRNA-processing protein TSR2